MRLVVMAPLLLLGLLGASAPAQAADRQCGSVTAVGLSDPVSGGTLAIDDRVFRVAGLGRNVSLPPVTTPDGLQTLFHVGARACVEGDFRVLTDGSVDVTNGSLFLDGSVPAGNVDLCGPLMFYSPATGTTNNQLGLRGLTFQLVLSGTVPPELGAHSTALNPEIVRLTGRLVQGVNTVADYVVVRVPSCAGLPNTSTLDGTVLPVTNTPDPIMTGTLTALGLAAVMAGARLVVLSRRAVGPRGR